MSSKLKSVHHPGMLVYSPASWVGLIALPKQNIPNVDHPAQTSGDFWVLPPSCLRLPRLTPHASSCHPNSQPEKASRGLMIGGFPGCPFPQAGAHLSADGGVGVTLRVYIRWSIFAGGRARVRVPCVWSIYLRARGYPGTFWQAPVRIWPCEKDMPSRRVCDLLPCH